MGSPSPRGSPLPERETLIEADPCALAARWGVEPGVLTRLVLSANDYFQETRGTVEIISGYRTAKQQVDLGRRGRPTAPDAVSTHRSCPATGVDVSLGILPVRVQKAIWGRIVTLNGLRWGGGGEVDGGGIPLDWQHVDLGPRRG